MGTTANLGLPYPENTDPLGNAAAAIQALANAIDARNTGWVNLTHSGSSGSMRYRVVSGAVYVEINVNFAAVANGGAITILSAANAMPAAYRPNQSLYSGLARVNAGNLLGLIVANNDGSVQIVNQSGGSCTAAQARYSYPVG